MLSEGRKWGVRSVVVEFGVFGAPQFSVQKSQNPFKNRSKSDPRLKTGFGPIWCLANNSARKLHAPSSGLLLATDLAISVATPVGTERSQIAQIAPKWLGESAKGGLGLQSGSAEKVSRTGASPVRTSANLFRTSARDFFCTSAPELQNTFRTLP